nr:transcriptional repressor [Brevibacterium daeguense]
MSAVTTTSTAELIRAAGLRVTAPRQAVLEVLTSVRSHPDAEEITSATRERIGKVSHQTVYDVLAAFERADLVRCIEPAGASAARYELQRHDNHHHMVCRSCQQIFDVPCLGAGAPCLHPDDAFGFEIEIAEVLYWGRCSECRATEGEPAAAAP